MSEQKYEEVGFTLKNGMKISLGRPGFGGETVMGEHLDLTIVHPNGSSARIQVTCSGRTDGDKYVEFVAKRGRPLEVGSAYCSDYGVSFQPSNIKSFTFHSSKKSPECTVSGVFNVMRLNLLPKKDE